MANIIARTSIELPSGLTEARNPLWDNMTSPTQFKVVGVSGSLREGSYNTALLRVAAEVAPSGMSVEIADISDLPIYNGDIERAEGFPEPVERFRTQLRAADGLLLATPEYNYSVTGAMKNAIDWASRRPSPLDLKPAAILGAGGGSGTARAQRHLREILEHNALQVVSEPQVLVARARQYFTDGELTDQTLRDQIRNLLDALLKTLEEAKAA